MCHVRSTAVRAWVEDLHHYTKKSFEKLELEFFLQELEPFSLRENC